MTTIREAFATLNVKLRKLPSGTLLCISHGENRFVMRKRSFQLFSLVGRVTENFSEGKKFPVKDEVDDNLTQFAHVNRDSKMPAGNVSVISLLALSGEIWGKGVERHSVTHSFSVPLL